MNGLSNSTLSANRLLQWKQYFDRQVSTYRTNNVLVMWGDDFTHRDNKSYDTLDHYISAIDEYLRDVNENQGGPTYKLHYSTMEQYFEAVFSEAMATQTTFDIETKDFWAYNLNSVDGAYWTGYYSTYPEIKREIMAFSDFV